MSDKMTFERMQTKAKVVKQGSAEFQNKNLVEIRDEKSRMFGPFKLMALKADPSTQIMRKIIETEDANEAKELYTKLVLLKDLSDPENIFLDYKSNTKGGLFKKKIYKFSIFYKYHYNHLMRHILIGLLISYKSFRKKLEYHGNVNQTSIIGVENPDGQLYPNNVRGEMYNTDTGKIKSTFRLKGKDSSNLKLGDLDLFLFKYRLIYSHVNMLTVKEWLDKRLKSLENKARMLMSPSLIKKFNRYVLLKKKNIISSDRQDNDTGVTYEDLRSNDTWSLVFMLMLTQNPQFCYCYSYREENEDKALIHFKPKTFLKLFRRFEKKHYEDPNLIYVIKRLLGFENFHNDLIWDRATVTIDRDLKFFIWLLTHKGHPQKAIQDFENNKEVENFDDFATVDSRGLQYKEENTMIIEEEESFEFEGNGGLVWDYGRRREYAADVEEKVGEAVIEPVKHESLQQNYIYGMKKAESVKVIPVVAATIPESESEEEEDYWETKRIYRNGWVMGRSTQSKMTGNLSERDPSKYPKAEIQSIEGYEYYLIRKEPSVKVIPMIEKPTLVKSTHEVSDEPTFPMGRSKSDLGPKKNSTPDVIESPGRLSRMLNATDEPSPPLAPPMNTEREASNRPIKQPLPLLLPLRSHCTSSQPK